MEKLPAICFLLSGIDVFSAIFPEIMAELHKVQCHPHQHSITCLDYSPSHEFLLAGDSEGSVHVYKSGETFELYTSFVSHTTFYDRDSNKIESERLASIRHFNSFPRAFTCLSANEKTVKLWYVSADNPNKQRLRLTYPNVHECSVHSLSVRSSKDHFLSSDDLSAYLWDADHPTTAFCIADFKPQQINSLREVLLFASFHRSDPALVLLTSTAGTVRVGDLRMRAMAVPAAIEMKRRKPKTSLFADMLSSVTGADFSCDGNMLFSREIMDVLAWDLRKPSHPVAVHPIITDERLVLSAASPFGEVDKFHVKAISKRGFVTGGANSEVVMVAEPGGKTSENLGLGPWTVPVLTCDVGERRLFAGVKNSLAVVHSLGEGLVAA